MTHAEVKAGCLSEEAIVKLALVGFGDLRGITDGVTIFAFSVACPHAVEGLLASEEVVSLVEAHLGVADFNTHSVVSALLVAVTEETDLTGRGDDTLELNANVVLAALPTLEVEWVVYQLIVVGVLFLGSLLTHDCFILIFI